MGFKEAVRTCLREKFITFSGRASRSEYWWFTLFVWLIWITFAVLVGVVGYMSGDVLNGQFPVLFWVLGGIFVIIALALYIPIISVMVRRFHDRNLSGWWVLGVMVAGAIPYVGFLASIAALVITVLKGTEGDNRFGPDPLNPATDADIFA